MLELYRLLDNGACTGHLKHHCFLVSGLSVCFFLSGSSDHGSLQQDLLFSPDIGKQCFNISIENDEFVEENEVFLLELSISSSNFPYQLHTPSASITIIDDDGRILKKFMYM